MHWGFHVAYIAAIVLMYALLLLVRNWQSRERILRIDHEAMSVATVKYAAFRYRPDGTTSYVWAFVDRNLKEAIDERITTNSNELREFLIDGLKEAGVIYQEAERLPPRWVRVGKKGSKSD